MASQTNEQALEAAIEKHLTGYCLEERPGELREPPPLPYHPNLYHCGLASDFDPQYAIDRTHFWAFLQQTQQPQLDQLQRFSPNDWQRKILSRFDRLMKKHGILYLLKKGLPVDDVHLTLMYPAPLASSSDSVGSNFAANIFSCTRQVRYSQSNPRQEIDMVLFINGIALLTLELKNAWTGQSARYHGQKQYRNDRDASQPLLNFGRCLVHMTLDTDEVYMTTKLAGKSTFFLPFNKGYNEGQGNPPNKQGHKTAYLWQQVFGKESLANIIEHFVRLDGSDKTPLNKRTLFFPRYHQLDVVRRLVDDCAKNGVGKTYLIQHSAGSGKSNSITWAAYQLIEVHPLCDTVQGSRGVDQPLFDSVIVVTDRRLLDKQLRDNINAFAAVKNIVAPAHTSAELKTALESGKKIIITTIQKFPYIIDGISDLSDRRFAVIIDEAHSSQDGDTHGKMNAAMGFVDDEVTDKILASIKARKINTNASYFAFTATPKGTTLEKFGQCQSDGSFVPFHLYAMKQAIEEDFILDVLANYTTYKSYYELGKSIADNPEFDSQKAQKKLRAYVERSQQSIDIKAEIMLEHFVGSVVNRKKLQGKAKAMVITQNIESAIRYYQTLTRLLALRGMPFKVAIAFSGKKEVGGVEYSEAQMNGFAESETKDQFDSDGYRLLVVANKYLTGFDQPKLTAMYVDKKLEGVLAVQALSRLNRAAAKWGKRTEDLFVLDFFNLVDDIKTSFDPYYTATSLSAATDINVLHDLKASLDDVGVYEAYEVTDFAKRYFDGEDGGSLSAIIDVAAARFTHELELEKEAKVDFKVKAKQFVKIYAQVALIMPYEMAEWETLYWFLKYLIPKLPIADPDADKLNALLESVDLSSYGLERVKLNHAIALDADEAELAPQNPNPRGAHDTETETDPLDAIIAEFNLRWFQGWDATPESQRVILVNLADKVVANSGFIAKYQDNADQHNRDMAFDKMCGQAMLQLRQDNLAAYKLWATDTAFQTSIIQTIKQMVDNPRAGFDRV